jgi:hypothetical protein
MGNLRQKYTDEEWDMMEQQSKSYPNYPEWTETNTNTNKIMTDPQLKMIRDLLEIFREWEEEWRHYSNNPFLPKPKNADELSKYLSNRYKIEKL